jgi:hypothetical protein
MKPPAPGTVLALALASLAPTWLVGLEQIVPPAILILGAGGLVATGRLRFPPEAWWFLAFLVATLGSAAALQDAAATFLYLRGSFHLLAGAAALLLAANQPPATEGWARWLRVATLFLLLLTAVALAVALDWLPYSFPLPFADTLPEFVERSTFVRDHMLERHLAREFRRGLLRHIPRYNGFFFYQGGMAAAVLALQPLVLLGRGRFGRVWDGLGVAALAGSFGCLLMSRSRLAIAFGTASVGIAVLWRALEHRPWRRAAMRALGAVGLLVAVWITVPIGGEALWERAFIDLRADSFIDRVDTYAATLERVGQRPLLGWGIQERAAEGRDFLRVGTHSDFLNVLYRFGWCGLTLYLATWVSVALGLGRSLLSVAAAEEDGRLTDLLVLAAALAAVAANALFRELQWDANVFWLCGALAGVGRAHAWAAGSRART